MGKIVLSRSAGPAGAFGLLEPVSQLAREGEDIWRSLGHDPYFEIRGPIPAGWYRASWLMGAAFPMPVTFFVQFASPRRDYVAVRCGESVPVAKGKRNHLFRFGHAVRRIQVQPCPRPGVFTFGDFSFEPEGRPAARALYAKNDLVATQAGWRSLGRDPVFECECAVPPGHYRLRWTARADFRLQFKIYFGADGDFSEAKTVSVSGGPPGARTEYSCLAHFAQRVTHLQLHPCECPGEFELSGFDVMPETGLDPERLHPRQQIEVVSTGPKGTDACTYRSLGVDPAFEIRRKLRRGWYDLSWRASASFPLDTRIYFGQGDQGFSEIAAASWGTVFSPEERNFEFRVRLDEPFDRLQLHPTPDRVGTFTLRDFRVRRRGIFRDRAADDTAKKISTRCTRERWYHDYWPGRELRAELERESAAWAHRPLVSILLPVFDPHERYLREAIESVQAQAYPAWELCVADDRSTRDSARRMLERFAALDPRIRVAFRSTNGHIAAATNSALELAQGEFVAFLDQDDRLHPRALHDIVGLLQHAPALDMVYTDEDKIDELGRHVQVVLKPDWSPDTLLSRMYVGHFMAVRRALVNSLGGLRESLSGSQDYDLVLRLAERTQAIGHLARVRYHWRSHRGSAAAGVGEKGYAFERGRLAVAAALARRGLAGSVHPLEGFPGNYEIRPSLETSPLVSIIVPFRDQLETTAACLASILERSTYRHFEIVLVDNGSDPGACEPFRREWSRRAGERIRFLDWDRPFNFSEINNVAVKEARGEVLLFLNNDTEVISSDWMERMLSLAMRPGVAAVGAKLLYSNGTVQHAGVVLGAGGVAGHAHRHLDRNDPGYGVSLRTVTNYAAVTAACLMCRRSVFDEAGGFDPALGIAFNDVDLCLRFLQAGYRNAYVPVELFHHESRSRGGEDSPQKQRRFEEEQRIMFSRWGERLARDPYFNPHFSRLRDDFEVDPLPADAFRPGRVELDLPARIVVHNETPRTVTGRCSFDSGAPAAEGWLYVDGIEVGPIEWMPASRARPKEGLALEFRLPGTLADGVHEIEILVRSQEHERAVLRHSLDLVQARAPDDQVERIAALRSRVPFDLPVQAFVEVTTACNLACVMCRFDVKGKDVATNLFLSRELFERLGPTFQALRVVHLYGWGEPTLHPAYVDFLRSVRARNPGARIVFTSNFMNIPERLMTAFIEERVDMINVSIDGATAAVYEGIRRHGSFDRLLATLDAFRKMKARYQSALPHLQYEFVVQRDNVHEMPAYVDLVDALGGQTITLEHVSDMPHLEIDYVRWLPAFRKAEKRSRERGIRLAGSALARFREAAGSGNRDGRGAPGRDGVVCHEPFQTIYVNPDGTITPCCMSRVVLGDLRTQALEEIWYGREYNDFREGILAGRLDARCASCVKERKNQPKISL